jgi:predicted transcriptional regulator
MKQTPCENILWSGLPVIRKEIAKSMVKDYSLNQSEVAKKLCVTPAAVCQYLAGKRGGLNTDDEEIRKEICNSASKIIELGNVALIPEICRLCKIFTSKGLFSSICESCKEEG